MSLKFLFLLSNVTLTLSSITNLEQCVDVKFNTTRSECVKSCFNNCQTIVINRNLGEELKISMCQNMLNTNLECICKVCKNF
ncbi:hypothetical protein IIV25_057R [Invertebrate iridovirus 25]|uniref:Uncharacterized protein n=1 Tax=Invertebrate iridovirus 25 TaxID=1301280 RepID=W8W2E7_9VIRU|nr:hypothetical protein IIV25_057R [Invertebrate iridovirus 25]CCV02075.1 hypothetical protein IIV25_057R [Invertebrate iridovirus 25]